MVNIIPLYWVSDQRISVETEQLSYCFSYREIASGKYFLAYL